MLEPLGIGRQAEALYVALAPMNAATVADLAEITQMAWEDVAEQIQQLRILGLAAETGNGLWRALPLSDVVKALRAQRQSELEMATIAAESLQSHLMAATNTQDDDVRIVVGREAIVAVYREVCDLAKDEICVFDKPPYVHVRDIAEESLRESSPEWVALGRKVNLRAIYHPGFDSERLKELLLFAAQGEQSRTAPVPMKLTIIDQQTAMIPSMASYKPGHETRASVVRHPLIVESLQWLFDAVWDTAVPIVAGSYLEGDPRRQMLVSLLMSGSTDTAIANQLGINVRSVRRWISELMDELGVTTRLQLGAALVRARQIYTNRVRAQ